MKYHAWWPQLRQEIVGVESDLLGAARGNLSTPRQMSLLGPPSVVFHPWVQWEGTLVGPQSSAEYGGKVESLENSNSVVFPLKKNLEHAP